MSRRIARGDNNIHVDAMSDSSSCAEITALPCVFIVAIGRTGSTHLLRVLNAIPGYRVSGETDNAWIYLGRWHEALRSRPLPSVAVATPSGWDPHTAASANAGRRLQTMHTPALRKGSSSRTLCALRELMVVLHNPMPRARVFGFKEIYSPFVREPALMAEVFSQGIGFVGAASMPACGCNTRSLRNM